MATTDDFERACRDTSRQLRRVPAELRRTLAAEVSARVADPLAARIASRWSGPYAAVLSAATRSRKGADPVLVVGGRRPVTSGGAAASQLVYGTEFGGGKRKTRTARGTQRRRRGGAGETAVYDLRSTQQFTRRAPAIIPTLRADAPAAIERWSDVVLEVLDAELGGA
jgi:hypothetical protein